MPSLAEVTAANQLDAGGLAAIANVDFDTAASWLNDGEIPVEHRGTVALAIGVTPDDLAGHDPTSKKPGRKRKKRRRGGLTADVDRAVRAACHIAYADETRRTAALRLAQVDPHDPDTDAADTTYDAVAKILSLSDTTKSACRALTDLWDINNPIKIGITLGGMDRRVLGEVLRVADILIGKPDEDLPTGDDAYLTVAERVTESNGHADTLDWLLELAS